MRQSYRLVSAAALYLAASGCLVTTSQYELKTREADTLRDGLASVNREKAALEARSEALKGQLAQEKETAARLAEKCGIMEEDLRKASDELGAARTRYEGTRITREQLINELLEKERTSGRRIQELSAQILALEAEAEKLRREGAAKETLIADLRKKAETAPDTEALLQERDMLLGRIERLTEERDAARRKSRERIASLAEAVPALVPGSSAEPVGPGLRLHLPEKALFRQPGKPELSDSVRALAEELRKVAAGDPRAAVVVRAPGEVAGEGIRGALSGDGGFAPDRVVVGSPGADRGADLFLIIP